MVSTIIGLVCALVVLWAIEMRFNQLFKINEELKMHILKLRIQFDELKNRPK